MNKSHRSTPSLLSPGGRSGPWLAGLAVLALCTLPVLVAPAQAQVLPTSPDFRDTEIREAVAQRFMMDPAINEPEFEVTVESGIVTLSGSVSTVHAAKRAEALAEATRGVLQVENRLSVRHEERPPEAIRSDVAAALLQDATTSGLGISVEAQSDGVVRLNGEVESWAQRELCAEIARSVRGVKRVANEISIAYESEPTDYAIQQSVERRVGADARIDSDDLTVEVVSAEVTMSGTVDSAAARTRLRSLGWVDGVQSVNVDPVDIVPQSMEPQPEDPTRLRSDADIDRDVVSALTFHPDIRTSHVLVDVEGGMVTLQGEVPSLAARKAAEFEATGIEGVRGVINEITVRPAEVPEDVTLAQRVRDALERDPSVDRREIDVLVNDGTAHLHGTVFSAQERTRAAAIAGRVSGVTDIENHLTIQSEQPLLVDLRIKENIESQLRWSPFVDADEVHVEVEDGIAVLTGMVDSYFEYTAAEDNANQGGAREVRNRLAVAEAIDAPGTE